MDTERGRKNVGGKIEIIMKVREPLVDKDVEVVNEKWLVLESHLRTLQMVSFLSDLFTTYLIRLFLLVHLLVISLPYLEKVLFTMTTGLPLVDFIIHLSPDYISF